jgi:Short C-terminal domain
MTAWIVISVLVCLPMLALLPRAFSRLRVSGEDPTRFEGPWFRHYTLATYTGYASDVLKRGDSYVTGSISSTVEHHSVGGGYGITAPVAKITGKTKTDVVVVDTFVLSNVTGQAASFSVNGFDAQIGDGHVVSVASLRRRKGDWKPFLIYNRTTDGNFGNEQPIRKLVFPFPRGYVILVCLTGLGIPVAFVFWFRSLLQQRSFSSKGFKPLNDKMIAQANMLPSQIRAGAPAAAAVPAGGGIASELQQLTALRESGALSEEEFAAAKAALLQPQ